MSPNYAYPSFLIFISQYKIYAMRLRRKRGNSIPTAAFLCWLQKCCQMRSQRGSRTPPSAFYLWANEWKTGDCASAKSGKLFTLTRLTPAVKAALRPAVSP